LLFKLPGQLESLSEDYGQVFFFFFFFITLKPRVE